MKPRSSGKVKSENGQEAVVDDPCWGDPEHCSLEHLLTLLDQNACILQETKDYVLINKPADLRMDKEFPATVHKLITYWYPPPTLQNHDNLLQHVSTLHCHSTTPDKEVQVRPCHQLDYATSGVLLMARNTRAAAHAMRCFEHRRVHKTYRAVWHGHVQPDPNWSVVPAARVTAFLKQQEDDYKRLQHKKRREAKRKTFQGFQPPHGFCQIWQGRYARKKGTGKRKPEKLSDEQWDQVDQALGLSEEECAELASLSWQKIKVQPKLKEATIRATDCYNTFLKEIIEKERAQEEGTDDDKVPELPSVFRVEGEDPNIFYVYLAMGQVQDDFAMRIPANTPNAPPGLPTADRSKLNFKVALTQCTILNNQATIQGQPVTKIELKPRTGRRHQLRVHAAFVGHTIVGDQTYESQEQKKANLSPRMCLHAYQLEFPLPPETSSSNNGKGNRKPEEGNEMLSVTAPDPFPVTEDGELKVAPM